MSKQLKPSINNLVSHWPVSAVMTAQHLSRQGYYAQLIKRYTTSGWIKKVGQGAYTKLHDPLTLVGALYALQDQLKLPVHLGGLSALEHHGLAHYLAMSNQKEVQWLLNTTNQSVKLPAWFKQNFPDVFYTKQHLFDKELGLEKETIESLPIIASSPERAILELLALVPTNFSYTHAYQIMENLQLLRPELLKKLLKNCLSIKVKRLFLHLADHHQLPCFKHFNLKAFDLGKGKRVIGSGGRYDAKYQLSVPLVESEDESGVGHV